jgi:opacity protein-like surface antigen
MLARRSAQEIPLTNHLSLLTCCFSLCLCLAAVSSVLLSPSAACADENYFAYSFGSETLPHNKWELYSWTTGRFGKGIGSYSALDFKQEVEYGVTDRFQVALEWNETYTNFTGGAGQEDADSGTPFRRNQFSYVGNAVELKYAFSSPYIDPIGIALFVEPEYALADAPSGDKSLEWELETRLIVQKNLLEDRMIAVLNLTNETEWERPRPSHGESFTTNFKPEITAGITYRFISNWFLGLETRYATELADANIRNQEDWAVSVGPALHYASGRWWATLTWLPQVAGWHNSGSRSEALDLVGHERNELRLKIGYDF